MIRVNAVVEGQTEEDFVNRVLNPYMVERNVVFTPQLVLVKRSGAARIRGGLQNYANPKWDIQQWMNEDKSAYCTTMFDYYGLPQDFPGMKYIPSRSTPQDRVIHLERSLSTDLGNPQKFIPYLQLHEFEALLFSDINVLDEILSTLTSESKSDELHQITRTFESPELINDNSATSPSKRLLALFPAYDKRVFGELVTETIGIDRIRSKCPHFNQWIERLERLASTA